VSEWKGFLALRLESVLTKTSGGLDGEAIRRKGATGGQDPMINYVDDYPRD